MSAKKIIKVSGYEGPERRKYSESNKILWWLLGMVSMIALGGGSAWMTHMQVTMDEIEHVCEMNQNELATQKERVSGIKEDLLRIETKLDRLLVDRMNFSMLATTKGGSDGSF